MTPDPDQVLLDLEDAQLRLANLRAAVAEEDHWRDEVARLTKELAHAKRKYKEATWKTKEQCRAEDRREKSLSKGRKPVPAPTTE